MERSSSRLSSRASLGRTASVRGVPPSQIKVFARFRPNEEGDTSCIQELTDTSVQITGLNQQFNFDRVFGPDSDQKTVFDEAVKPTVEGVLAGYNGCVLAYGQTGAGKSHTMMGGKTEQDRGAIPRMIDYLFAEKPDSHTVKVGYLEIYKEKVRDLLAPVYPGDDLRVHEVSGGGGFYVKGLTEINVSSANELYKVMQRGDRNRSTAATNMNAHSSRSHSVFFVDVYGPHTRSKLVLVDLAGSEKIAKTGARGNLLEEAVNINKSLTSLGMVVNALAAAADQASGELDSSQATSTSTSTPQQSSSSSTSSQQSKQQSSQEQPTQGFQHVPFRDSKLTRILQDSLAGNSRTCLIVHCSPSSLHLSETVSTLRFGIRAKHVKTVPRINYKASHNSNANSASANSLIGQLQNESSYLQQQLLTSYRDLNNVLVAEQSRLLAQKYMDTQTFVQNNQQITDIESRLKEEEREAQLSEHYLFTELNKLEPRISAQFEQ